MKLQLNSSLEKDLKKFNKRVKRGGEGEYDKDTFYLGFKAYSRIEKRLKNGEEVTRKEFYKVKEERFRIFMENLKRKTMKKRLEDPLYNLNRTEYSKGQVDLAYLLVMSTSRSEEFDKEKFENLWIEPSGLQ